MIRYPMEPIELERFRGLLPATKPSRPYAFIYGHGLWNDLDLQATLDWLDLVLDTTISVAPWLQPGHVSSGTTSTFIQNPSQEVQGSMKRDNDFWPRLIMTPNAAGKEKPDEWLVTQGNKALMIFEESVKVEAEKRGIEHLGTWNMSIQANKFDGV